MYNKSVKNRGFAPLIILIVVVLIGGVAFFIYQNKFKKVPYKYTSKDFSHASPIPYTPKFEGEPQKYMYLKYKNGDAIENLTYTSQFGDGEREIVRWKDYLFYIARAEGKYEIDRRDLKTNTSSLVLNLETTNSNGRNYDPPLLQILDDKLFISQGGYLMPGQIYYVQLPTGKPIKFSEPRNGRIEKIGDRYWLTGGEGDACWGERDYSLLNMSTMTAKYIITSEMGCGEGNEVVALDNNYFYLALHHYNEKTGDIFYENIVSQNIDSGNKQVIVAGNNMPPKITNITYLNDTGKLILQGDKTYSVDLSTKALTEVPPIATPTPTTKTQKEILDERNTAFIKSLDLPSSYYFVIE